MYIYIYTHVFSCAYTCTQQTEHIATRTLSWSWSDRTCASQPRSQTRSELRSLLVNRLITVAISTLVDYDDSATLVQKQTARGKWGTHAQVGRLCRGKRRKSRACA